MNPVLGQLLPPLLAFGSTLFFVRFVMEGIVPRYGRRVSDAEALYRQQLTDLFLPPDWARVGAVGQYFGGIVGALIVWIASGSVIGAAVAGVALYYAPPLVLRQLAAKRRERIEQQLPEALEVMASGARAGLSLREMLRLVVDKGPDPIRQEFGLIVHAIDLGASLETALHTAAKRLRMSNFQLTVTALMVAKERGGSLPTLLGRLATSVSTIAEAEKRVLAETASIRFSAKVMIASIPLLGLALIAMEPETVNILFGTLFGNVMLVAVGGLATLGYLWIVRLGNPDL